MRIPELFLCIIFVVFQANCRILRNNVKSFDFVDSCKGQNKNNESLEISNCLHSIEIKSNSDNATYPFTRIRFNDVVIENIRENALKNFPDLEHLVFNSSEIRNIHEQAFAGNELVTLSFENCKFLNVSNLNIQCLDLEELVIKNSNLKRMPNFEDFPSLIILNLNNNRINTIKEKVFKSLSSLEEVYLNNNELTSISPKLFYANLQLTVLDLSYNFLTSFEFEGTNQLDILNLAHNQLRNFDAKSSEYLKTLRKLDLSFNEIIELNQDTFRNMPQLEIIDLSYNKLNVLENNILSHNSVLEQLTLDGNNFKTLPIFKSDSKNIFFRIYNFSCKKCELVSLEPFTFESMPELVHLTLSKNNLEILDPKAFASIHNLKYLDLSNNKLTRLGNVFSDNKELTEINLSGNPLKTLNPNVFTTLTNLKKLDASKAELKSLWTDNFDYVLKDLEHLVISNNSIEDITTNDLKVMPNLKYIDLENNPIQCTIHLVQLVKWLTSHDVLSTDGAHFLRTNEKLLDDAAQYFEDDPYDHKSQWLKLAMNSCRATDSELKNRNNDSVIKAILQNIRDVDSVPKVYPPQPAVTEEQEVDEDDEDDDEYGYVNEAVLDDDVEVNKDKYALDQATYIISVTSVFIITALIVLSAAVSITLVILKKHNTLNINNANLPRFKIPRWETLPSLKKHSGSIYRPLSEEILAPPTPKIHRYEFPKSSTPNA